MNKRLIERLKQVNLRDYLNPDEKKQCDCPVCNRPKGMKIYRDGNNCKAKCFHCGAFISDILDYVSKTNKLETKKDFPKVVVKAAQLTGIDIGDYNDTPKSSIKSISDMSFYEHQLDESGLTLQDVKIKAKDIKTGRVIETYAFQKGGIDRFGNINNDDDEMLIYYYDLNGKQVMFCRTGSKSLHPYVRVRWSNPDLHKNADGKPTKYQTPPGAECQFYFPQYIRDRYEKGVHFDTLFIQEGEKKAEKACKHGVYSIGIQGIYNIGNNETGLIQGLQYLVKRCCITNIVLLMDSDWNRLSKNLQKGDSADQRPLSFARAVIKFKEYVKTLENCGLSVDIYFAHINENEKGDKGIDDLLTNTLKGRENLLLEDIETTMNTHNGKGKYIDIHKVSTITDFKILDFWHLNNVEDFYNDHRDELSEIGVFKLNKVRYTIKDGSVSPISKYLKDEEFWFLKQAENGNETVAVNQVKIIDFLEANGYRRIKTKDCGINDYRYIHMDGHIIEVIGEPDIRDFIYSYIRQATKDQRVHSFFADKLGKILDTDRLERIKVIKDEFEKYEIDVQRFYFKNSCIKVTPTSIGLDEIVPQVWYDRIINRKFDFVPLITSIKPNNEGGFDIVFSEEAESCEFLQFIRNTSDFWNSHGRKLKQLDSIKFSQHLVNKITAIGYLLTDYKYPSEQKAVIAMDGINADSTSESNGRTGKSLVGVALSKMLNQTTVDGRNAKNDDEFIYSLVTVRTRNIFMDDVKKNFDFERLFSALTGDLLVNPKMGQRFILHYEDAPKFYITTNHAINADSRSANDRIVYMEFSNWYNDIHRPIDDFGHQFFTDWDYRQWNLFYNFMIECCHYYLRSMNEQWYRFGHGAVPPPMDDIRLRQQSQHIGESFLIWAEQYFDTSQNHLNKPLNRQEMQKSYAENCSSGESLSPVKFKEKLRRFCEFSHYHFNPHKPNVFGVSFADFKKTNDSVSFVGMADKRHGVEYFIIATDDWSDKTLFG